jgi:hypothetical protein
MGVLPEGYNTIQAILLIAEKLHVPAPLAKGLWDVINARYSAERFISSFIRDFVDIFVVSFAGFAAKTDHKDVWMC